jgi:hypothetical protein
MLRVTQRFGKHCSYHVQGVYIRHGSSPKLYVEPQPRSPKDKNLQISYFQLLNMAAHVRFLVLSAASMKTTAFWNIALHILVEVYRRFRGYHWNVGLLQLYNTIIFMVALLWTAQKAISVCQVSVCGVWQAINLHFFCSKFNVSHWLASQLSICLTGELFGVGTIASFVMCR